VYILVQSIHKEQLCDDDRAPLEANRGPRVIVQMLNLHHPRVDQAGRLGKDPFKHGKYWRII
jgi:hypothetical protein